MGPRLNESVEMRVSRLEPKSCGATAGDSLGLQSEVSGLATLRVAERRQVFAWRLHLSPLRGLCVLIEQHPRTKVRGYRLTSLRDCARLLPFPCGSIRVVLF